MIRRFFLKLFRRRRLEQDMEAELAFHRQMSREAGNPIPLGHVSTVQEQARDLWRFNFAENLWRDLVYSARGLRRSPALVLSAVLSLGLGIGANTAIFSLGMEFLFSQPSVTDPDSWTAVRIANGSHTKHTALEFLRDSQLFADVVGNNEESYANWSDGTETRPIFAMYTTSNYFTALGIPMAIGRGYAASDPVETVVLGDAFWRKHLNADASIVGRFITLEGKPYTVTGVLPRVHRTVLGFGFTPDVYLPRYLGDTSLSIYAKLKPGMSIGEANAGLAIVTARMDTAMPSRFKYSAGHRVMPLVGIARIQKDNQLLPLAVFFAMLLVVVGLVLLIACTNVASLLLARASARRREIAVRLALGASRGRLLQQLLTESLVLCVLGAAAGVLLSTVVANLIAQVQLPLPIPIHLNAEIDTRVMLYAALLAMVATVACGLLPAWQSAKQSITQDVHREPRMRLRRFLVAAQISVSVVVLVTGFLFLRNLLQASAMSPGFDLKHTLRAEVHLPPVGYQDEKKKALYIERVRAELESLPGIEAAAAARIVPFTDNTRVSGDGTLTDTGEKINLRFSWNAVTSDYFRAMDIPILAGRFFAEREGEKVAIVNRTFVERYLGKRNPVGFTFLWHQDQPVPIRIVGVVAGTKTMTIGEDDQPQLYEPLAQIRNTRSRIQFVLRSAVPPSTQLAAVNQAVRAIDPNAGVEVATMFSSIGLAFLPSQVGAVLLGSMGILGLLLASVGLYGVMVYTVVRRTREIGLRMAIGAARGDIRRMVLLDSMKLLVTGAAIGIAIAVLVTRPLAMFLVPGLKPTDPSTYIAVAAVLLVTGLLAAWSPARRASSIDPMTCLRME